MRVGSHRVRALSTKLVESFRINIIEVFPTDKPLAVGAEVSAGGSLDPMMHFVDQGEGEDGLTGVMLHPLCVDG